MIIRVLLALALLLAGAGTAAAAGHVGGCVTQNGASSSSSVACTLGGSVTSNTGDLAAVWVVTNGVTVSSVSDDKSDSCTTGTAIGGTIKLTPVYCLNLTSGAHIFTAMLSGSATLGTIIVDTYAVIKAVDQVTQQAQTTPGGTTNAVTSGNTASAAVSDLVVGASVQSTGIAGSGFINAGSAFTGSQSVSKVLESEYQNLATAGAAAATFTAGNVGDSFLTSVMTFTTYQQMSKINGYSVLQLAGPNMSKMNAYAVLQQAASLSKMTGYMVLCNTPGIGACPAGPPGGGGMMLLGCCQ